MFALFTAVSLKFGLPNGLLDSLCYIESKHTITAVHHDDGGEDSLGLCQVKISTAKWLGFRGTKQQLINPKTNTYYAAKYLSYQIKRYHGQINKAIIAYNMGHAGQLTKTQYSVKVFKHWRKNAIHRR